MGGGTGKVHNVTLDEYVERVKDTAFRYPWIDSATACKKTMTEAELVRMRQEFFFEK